MNLACFKPRVGHPSSRKSRYRPLPLKTHRAGNATFKSTKIQSYENGLKASFYFQENQLFNWASLRLKSKRAVIQNLLQI